MLSEVLGVFDENMNTVARELGIMYRVDGCRLILEGEEAEIKIGAETVESLKTVVKSGERIDKGGLLYCIALAREGRAGDVAGIMKDVVAVTYRGKPVKCKTVGQKEYVRAIGKNTVTFGVGPAGTGKTYLAVCLAAASYKSKQVGGQAVLGRQ